MRITVAESPQTDGWRWLLRQAKRPVWVKSAVLTIGRLLPVSAAKRTFSETVSMSQTCHRNRRSIVHRRESVFTLTTIENGYAACPRFSSDACRIRPSCRPPDRGSGDIESPSALLSPLRAPAWRRSGQNLFLRTRVTEIFFSINYLLFLYRLIEPKRLGLSCGLPHSETYSRAGHVA